MKPIGKEMSERMWIEIDLEMGRARSAVLLSNSLLATPVNSVV
jgi:hypothetical protein